MNTLHLICLAIPLLPLTGSLLAGLMGRTLGVSGSHFVTISGISASFIFSAYIAYQLIFAGLEPFSMTVYHWGLTGRFAFEVGFLMDQLTAIMLLVVTFVSLLVHIYSIGYMAGDSGYQRFFSYISLFTFAMLMLVMANNFLQLFFGWEAVGLVSYLLIGFWFKRESANFGSLKAFIVNRIGDFGFLLGIALIFNYMGSLNFNKVFNAAPLLADMTVNIFSNSHWSIITVICIFLFIGAMGKSAQVPLHVWLPESMEGPTPISALIHAATMVTAGVYMVARMSPLFEYSPAALNFILIIGAIGALFTGILAIVQHDIKRVVAYSTLSQLGYMVVALGASAYAASLFHLVTHAFFKALLFLAAGSVIIGLHHEQDMRKMGNLRKYMPVTYITFLIGAFALAALPPFAGYYSKEAIIEAVHLSTLPAAHFAYYCVLLGAFVTAFYIFRALFLVFYGQEKFDQSVRQHLHESPMVVLLPLILLAIPSVVAGALLIKPLLFESPGLLGSTVYVLPRSNVLAKLATDYQGAWHAIYEAIYSLPFWLSLAGIFTAWLFYVKLPQLPEILSQRFLIIYRVLLNKYGFDDFNQLVFVRGIQKLSHLFFTVGDEKLLDDKFVNGSGRLINWFSRTLRALQTGYLYHYALAMVMGLLVLLTWFLLF